jgi:L-ribulokinase
VAVYERLYPIYRDLYFAMGTPDSSPLAVGRVLPEIRAIAAEVRATDR